MPDPIDQKNATELIKRTLPLTCRLTSPKPIAEAFAVSPLEEKEAATQGLGVDEMDHKIRNIIAVDVAIDVGVGG